MSSQICSRKGSMHTNRRNFLKISAATLSLFFEEASNPANAFAKTAPKRKVALVIGNATYVRTKNRQLAKAFNLNSPLRDSRAVAAALKRKGFDVQKYEDVGPRQLKYIVDEFARAASVADVSFFYFSGHGISIDQSSYLIPVGMTEDDILNVDDYFIDHSANISSFESVVARAGTLGIIVLDSCRDNPYVTLLNSKENVANISQNPHDYGQGLATFENTNFFLACFATAPGDVARDGRKGELSPFTTVLVDRLKEKARTVSQLFAEVQTMVCDQSSPAHLEEGEKAKCQSPYVNSNLGVNAVSLDDEEIFASLPMSGLLVSEKLADLDDEAVQRFLGKSANGISFQYVWTEVRPRKLIYPNHDYFSTYYEKGISIYQAQDGGYFAPEETSSTWSLSYPVLDIVCRKTVLGQIELGEIIFEVENSVPDFSPYTTVFAPASPLYSIVLVNDGWSDVAGGELEFSIYGHDEIDVEEISEKLSQIGEKFKYRKTIGRFQNDLTVSLESELEQHLSDFDFYRKLSSAEYDSDGTTIVRVLDTKTKKKASPSAEFSAWLGKKTDPQFDMNGVYVWIVGKLTVRSSRAGVKEVVSIFSAPVCLINPGVGGGAIEFDARHIVRLPLEAQHSLISFAIGKTLNSEKETYRGLFTLHAPRSSFHTIRWLIRDRHQKVLYESPWSDLHVFIPKSAYRAVKQSGIKDI